MDHLLLKSAEFKSCLHGFLLEVKKDQRNPQVQDQFPSMLGEYFLFMEHLGISSVNQIKQSHVDLFCSYLETRPNRKRHGGLKISSINKFKNCIRIFGEYLKREGVACKRIVLRDQKAQTRLPTILSEQEVVDLFASAEDTVFGARDRAMLALLYGCGLRRLEVFRLDVTDLNLNKGWIHVRRTKNNHERFVPMSAAVQRHIEDYLNTAREVMLSLNGDEKAVLISERGSRLSKESQIQRIRKLQKMSGNLDLQQKKIAPHILRHSIGTHLYKQGMKLENIALILGHRSLDSTQIYVHLNNLRS